MLESFWLRRGCWFSLSRGPLDDQRLGRIGEALAGHYLARQGLRSMATRRVIAGVEVDLIVRSGQRPVLVEVKCSAQHRGLRLNELRFRPGLRFDGQRWVRLQRAAKALAQAGEPARIDLVEVLLAGPGREPEVYWHRDCAGPWPHPSPGLGWARGSTGAFFLGSWQT
jgi:Holliday junction resolvase-like predicted endonuclease